MMHVITVGWLENSGVLRAVGITELLQNHTNTSLLLLLGILTQLGDVWFLVLLTSSIYLWASNHQRLGISREQGAGLLAIVFLYLGLITLLKHTFLLPRPPGAMTPPPIDTSYPILRRIITSLTTATTPGFPSGHALGSTLVYGTIASITKYSTSSKRWVAASSLIGIIGITRIALGLHYVGDVIAGITIGLLSLPVLLKISDDGNNPIPVFILGILFGSVGVFTVPSPMSASALGGGIGGIAAWVYWHSSTPDSGTKQPFTWNKLILTGGVFLASGSIYWIVPGIPSVFFASLVLVSGIISIPLVRWRFTAE